jgi:hypothetical protein
VFVQNVCITVKQRAAEEKFDVIDGMHRVTAVNDMLEAGTLRVQENDHMVYLTKKAHAEKRIHTHT